MTQEDYLKVESDFVDEIYKFREFVEGNSGLNIRGIHDGLKPIVEKYVGLNPNFKPYSGVRDLYREIGNVIKNGQEHRSMNSTGFLARLLDVLEEEILDSDLN